MKKIYIVTTYTGTYLSRLIRKVNDTPYAHVSIALNEDLEPMYSFGRLHPKTPIFAGFVEEYIHKGLYANRPKTNCRVYTLNVTPSQYSKLKENINFISENRKKYKYDVRGLILLSLNKQVKNENRYVCSNFVADMLVKSDIKIFDKPSYTIQPEDYYNSDELTLIYEGLLCEYYLYDLMECVK